MPSTVAVKCTDSERQMARICIPVNIIIFAEEDFVTMQYAQLIVLGIKNAAQLSDSQAE